MAKTYFASEAFGGGVYVIGGDNGDTSGLDNKESGIFNESKSNRVWYSNDMENWVVFDANWPARESLASTVFDNKI